MIKTKCVLLMKTQKGDGSVDKYEDLLLSNGFEEKLSRSNEYAGIILSSPRCVHAVDLALSDDKTIIHKWQTKHNFVVGEATYEDALEKLQLDCGGKESGNAVKLSKVILEKKSLYDNKPFLFPHGNLKTDTLKLELGKEGITIEGVLVYDTIANPNIEEEIKQATEDFTCIPEYVVFFSPSGLHSSINYLKRFPMDLDNVKFVAIGPVTELAIIEENLKVHGVTQYPSPQAVLDLILND